MERDRAIESSRLKSHFLANLAHRLADSASISRRPAVPGSSLFGLITDKMIRRGTVHSVEELERAIYAWLTTWNDKPKSFVWKATADVILEKVRRCKELNGTAHRLATS